MINVKHKKAIMVWLRQIVNRRFFIFYTKQINGAWMFEIWFYFFENISLSRPFFSSQSIKKGNINPFSFKVKKDTNKNLVFFYPPAFYQ